MSSEALMFKVKKFEPELITPAKPTPHEFKPLSDLDDREALRSHFSVIHFYRSNPTANGLDPVKVIRKAIAETLVYYYPFAGRLRELSPSRKLIVECTAEGVLFVEAQAHVTLEEFGYPLAPPFPCWDQLVVEYPEPNDSLSLPLLLIQVTRLKCGGFTFAYHFNHTICDGSGIAQFLSAVAEIAKGATSPSVHPTWKRHIFSSQNPPILTFPIHEYDMNSSDPSYDDKDTISDLRTQSFFFGPSEISALRGYFGHIPDLRHCTSFDVISACVMRCRVVALQPHPQEVMGLNRAVNLRGKFKDLVPVGYYGNAVVVSTSTSTAKEILVNPLRVVRNAMNKVTKEYVQNVIHLLVTNDRKPRAPLSMKYHTESNLRYLGLKEVDFGWGKALYAGLVTCSPYSGSYTPFKDGILLPLCLPKQAMQRFVKEMDVMLKGKPVGGGDNVLISKM